MSPARPGFSRYRLIYSLQVLFCLADSHAARSHLCDVFLNVGVCHSSCEKHLGPWSCGTVCQGCIHVILRSGATKNLIRYERGHDQILRSPYGELRMTTARRRTPPLTEGQRTLCTAQASQAERKSSKLRINASHTILAPACPPSFNRRQFLTVPEKARSNINVFARLQGIR